MDAEPNHLVYCHPGPSVGQDRIKPDFLDVIEDQVVPKRRPLGGLFDHNHTARKLILMSLYTKEAKPLDPA